MPSHDESPEQHTLRGELGDLIQRAILTLSEYQRATLVLIDAQGQSYEEVAEITGASLGTVKSRLSSALALVRDYLAQRPELLPSQFRREG